MWNCCACIPTHSTHSKICTCQRLTKNSKILGNFVWIIESDKQTLCYAHSITFLIITVHWTLPKPLPNNTLQLQEATLTLPLPAYRHFILLRIQFNSNQPVQLLVHSIQDNYTAVVCCWFYDIVAKALKLRAFNQHLLTRLLSWNWPKGKDCKLEKFQWTDELFLLSSVRRQILPFNRGLVKSGIEHVTKGDIAMLG